MSGADEAAAYDYVLPEEAIAQQPLARRDAARMLVLHRATGQIEHRHVRDLPEYFQAGDLLVSNDTRVRPAVAQDGPDITFRGFEKGTVFLHMKGACAGCPSSTATLKHGIQNLLRHFVPEVEQVEQVV